MMRKSRLALAVALALVSLLVLRSDTRPRGIRNNNPLNIRENAGTDYQWQGEAAADIDPAFEEFESPEMGYRAAVRILRSYAGRGIRTVGDIVATWAPATENDVGAYVASVVQQMGRTLAGVDPGYRVQAEVDFLELLKAMTVHENGFNPYPDSTIIAGIRAA